MNTTVSISSLKTSRSRLGFDEFTPMVGSKYCAAVSRNTDISQPVQHYDVREICLSYHTGLIFIKSQADKVRAGVGMCKTSIVSST